MERSNRLLRMDYYNHNSDARFFLSTQQTFSYCQIIPVNRLINDPWRDLGNLDFQKTALFGVNSTRIHLLSP